MSQANNALNATRRSGQELEDEFWAEELGEIRKICRETQGPYEEWAQETFRRPSDCYSLISEAIMQNGPTKLSWAYRALQEANKPLIEKAKRRYEARCRADAESETEQTATAGRKRKATDDLGPSERRVAEYKQDLSWMKLHRLHMDLGTNDVREFINKVINQGVVKKVEFCNAIGCSNAAVNQLLKRRWPDEGRESKVYFNAWEWFKQRQIAGLKMPNVTAAKKRETAQDKAPQV